MPSLNLPAFDTKITSRDGRPVIFDSIRLKYVALTPEEWVRQHFIQYLISCKAYPQNLLANEINLQLHGTTKRCDSIVYDIFLVPLMILEYKAPHVTIKREVFDQISRYNAALRVKYLTVSNGLTHYCCMIDYASSSYSFLSEIPLYSELVRPGS
ncbi:MAG: type I restriction enzyme HsdR N-terminal domain-containing protein [Tannerellaceae bacterium]|nr:type I restriction enzyme HsdR N-terminal domain-containing protein [Tannerellaceae bacterium]